MNRTGRVFVQKAGYSVCLLPMKRNIRRKDFYALADNLGIQKNTSYIPDDMNNDLTDLINNRISVLTE